ncbi:MAG: M3 family oligoendopeptidase [Chlamydiia bacterium]|nr:M3 family oligoendopeptidase [Chlamydiia bacterium]
MKYPMVWDLESIFEGGSQSATFQNTLHSLQKNLTQLKTWIQEEKIAECISLLQDMGKTTREMQTFTYCLLAQDVQDTHASVLAGQMRTFQTDLSNASLLFNNLLVKLSDEAFNSLLKEHPSIAFSLEERRKRTQEKLPIEEEAFINHLSMDGYHGWSEMWDAVIGEMTFPFQDQSLYFGQIENKLSDPDRTVRTEAFNQIESGFREKQQSIAQILNHLGGFRLQVYKKRKWEDFLKEPLDENRLSKDSLLAMWGAVENNRERLTRFLECKARLLGLKRLSWADLEAPISNTAKEISYEEAADIIVSQFQTFSPKMAHFAQQALEKGWIEAEDRQGKRPGGFCVALPNSCESRIFMTFSNTITNLYTLAHELGHAFHNEVVFPLDEMVQHPTMGLAETASTMAEMIVTQAMIQKEKDPKQRLLLLDDHLSRAISFLLNIHARFLFETRFYEKRRAGIVSHEGLSKLMEGAQQEAYGGKLDRYHPLFWAAKIHYYCTDMPFYNFPYTFGYLFSLGIYHHAKTHSNFESSYIALLEDTGRMTPEVLAKTHLDTDLTTTQFWQQGIDLIHQDMEEFIKLSSEVSLCG